MKQESLPRDRELKTAKFSGQVQTNDSQNYYNNYGCYRGTKNISEFTGYNSDIWNKRLFAFIQKSISVDDGSVCYPSTLNGNVVQVITFKASRTANIDVIVCYY